MVWLMILLHLDAGMAQYVNLFAEPGDPEYAPPVPEVETPVCCF